MKKLLLVLLVGIFMVFMVSIAHGASIVTLVDNTLVTDEGMLRYLATSNAKVLIVTGTGASVNISFAIIEDGITTKTITLTTATSEKYVATHPIRSFKVDWTETAGTASATLSVVQ